MTKAELITEVKRLKRQIARDHKVDEKAAIVVRGGTVIIPDGYECRDLIISGGVVCGKEKLKVKVSGAKP